MNNTVGTYDAAVRLKHRAWTAYQAAVAEHRNAVDARESTIILAADLIRLRAFYTEAAAFLATLKKPRRVKTPA